MGGMSVPLIPLNDGRAIPQLGLGVYKIGDEEAARTVAVALEAGYRHVDTATLYGNERGVGEGIRASGLPREQVFVTTKVWNDECQVSKCWKLDAQLGGEIKGKSIIYRRANTRAHVMDR